ncbi:hypothetical protein PQX77_000653 [Marasmius sp. AFHP31]|nr:hypothetical protein PQX77_000653 [Marasmius sp. AFHP31]
MGQPTQEPSLPTDAKSKGDRPTEVLKLGVYEVTIEKRTPFLQSFAPGRARELKNHWTKTFSILRNVLSEVILLQPSLVMALIGLQIWDDMQGVVVLSLETKMLTAIEHGLKHGSVDVRAMLSALGMRLACVVFGSYITDRCRNFKPAFDAAIDRHYEDMILKAKLSLDLPALQENIKYDQIDPRVPRRIAECILELCGWFARLVGHMSLLLGTVRLSNHGWIYAIICLVRPAIKLLFLNDTLWSSPRVVRSTNEDYKRMMALTSLTNKRYRHEVISGNLIGYITSEFKKAQTALGSISTESPEWQFYRNSNVFSKNVMLDLAEDLPIIYNAFVMLLRPAQMSLTLLAILQKSATELRWSFQLFYCETRELQQNISNVERLIELQNLTKSVKEGKKPYPTERENPKGMAVELKNVTFSYPADAESTKKALDDVSFRINPGELVVVVGENGSGKSTFINLLTRMYDVSSGEILIDGDNIRSLQQSDFRQAVATLTQDHHLLPLTLAENIGLGYPKYVSNKNRILEAARKGGCEGILERLDSGLDTVLDPAGTQYHALVNKSKKDSALAKEAKKLDKSSGVSGGERQRLVAARTFMRLKSKKVKFVAVDEPSSALDPRGEEDLFDHLREAREGKTMLFVTHRFGPITKYADRIICMKDGKLVEHGTHMELMEKQGEYYKMYNIQARAFDDRKTTRER